MKIGICQFDIAWEDKETNKRKIKRLLNSSKRIKEVDWLIFPEMTLSGFSMHKKVATLSKEDIDFFKGISLDYSLYLSFGGVVDNYNRFITLDKKGNILSRYSKMHLFAPAGEDKVYKRGAKGVIFSLDGFNITPCICYDLRFSYLFWLRERITDIFVVIANWPSVRREHWVTLLKARAIENQSYVAGVNRIGKDPQAEYAGDSLVVDPCGRKIMHCGAKEGIFVANVDKQNIKSARQHLPVLKNRREDLDVRWFIKR